MIDFCSIAPPSQVAGKLKSYRITKTSDSGHTRIRPQGRTPKKEWTLSWDSLTQEDFDTLIAFFDDNFSAEFDWTHPQTGTVYTVYFVSEEIEYEYVPLDRWKVSFKIGEV